MGTLGEWFKKYNNYTPGNQNNGNNAVKQNPSTNQSGNTTLAAWFEKYNNYTPSGADTVQPPAGAEVVVPSTQPNGYKSQNAAHLSSGLSRDDFDSSVRNRNQLRALEESRVQDTRDKVATHMVMTGSRELPALSEIEKISPFTKGETMSFENGNGEQKDFTIPYFDYESNKPNTVIQAEGYLKSTGETLKKLQSDIENNSARLQYYESSVNKYVDELERLAARVQSNPTAAGYAAYNSLYEKYQKAYSEYETFISEHNAKISLYNDYTQRYETAAADVRKYNEQWDAANLDFFEKSKIGLQNFYDTKETEKQAHREAENEKPWWQKILDANAKSYTITNENPAVYAANAVVENYRNDTSYKEPSDEWTDGQKNIFGYLWAVDKEKASEFAITVNESIAEEKEGKTSKKIKDWVTQNLGTGILGTAGALLLSPTAIADVTDNLVEYVARGRITKKGALSPFDVSQAITGGITEELNETYGTIDEKVPVVGGKGLGDLYQLGYSMAQSMTVGKISKLAGNSAFTYATFFGQGAASGIDKQLDAGGTAGQAICYGLVVGAAEAVFEEMGIESLFKEGNGSLLKEMLKQGGVESLEEGLTSVVDFVADTLIMMDKSAVFKAAEEYSKFMSEDKAKLTALMDVLEGITYDAMGGLITGGADTAILAGANKVGQAVDIEKQKRHQEQTIKNADAVIGAYAEAVQKYGENSPQAMELKSKAERAYIEKVRANLRLGMLNGKSTTVTTQERSEEEITQLVTQAQAAGDATAETGYYSGASDQLIKFAQQEKAILKQLTGRDVDIRFYQTDVGENGHCDPETGTIYVNVNSERPFSYIEGHEFTHELENSAGYAEYAEWIKTEGLGAMYNTYKENIKKRYEDRGINLTELELEQEVVATWTGENLFTDDTTMKKLIKKLSDGKPTLARRIFGGIRRFVSRSRSGITRNHYERALYLYQQMAQGKSSPVSSAQTVNENAPTSFPAETAKASQKQKNTAEAVNTAENDIMISNGEAVAQDNGKFANDSEFTPAVRELVDRIADTARQIEASDQKGADYRRLKKEQKANLRALEQLRREGKIDSVEYNRAIETLRDTTEGPEYSGIEESKANLQAQFEAGEIALEDYESAMAELEEVGAEEGSPGKIKYSLSETIAPTRKELESKKPIKVVNVKVGLESESYADMKVAAKNKATNEGWFDIPHHNVDTDSFIFLTEKSFTHAFSNLRSDFGEDTIRCMAHIPEIIQEAVLVSVDNPKDNRKAETKVYTFFGAIDGVNGVEPVKLTVKEFDFRSLDAVPKNIRNYFEKNGISEKYNSLYDTHALEVIGIEGIQKESDASGRVGEQGPRAQATSDSIISIADLLNLVKGKAEKYIPKYSFEEPTREDVISELRQYMNGARSKDQIRDVIARVKKNPQSEIYGGPARRPQYSEGVQRILDEAERDGMSVRDYISQNIDEFEVRGKLTEDARKALEISGDYRKFSVEDVRASRPPRSIEELDRILAEAEPLDPNEFRKTDFDRWYERREKEDQLREKMAELVMKAPDENEINTTLEELASDLENGYITPGAALEIVEGLRAETDGARVKYSLNENAKENLHRALYDTKHRSEVLLRDDSPTIMTSQKGVKNLPMVMNASHIRENVFTEEEAKQLGLQVNEHTHYHGLGEEFFLMVIDGLDNVTEAYRGTKTAEDASRRENYFLLVSEFTDKEGNTINVPVYINEHAQYNRVFVDVNKISTVFGRDSFRDYINRQLRKNNLVKIKNRSTQASEGSALIAEAYGMNTSVNDSISPVPENVNKKNKKSLEDIDNSSESKALNQLVTALSKRLKMKKLGKQALTRLIRDFATDKYATKEDLFKDVKEAFDPFELISEIQATMRDVPIKVSEAFRKTDEYGKFTLSNIGKLRFSKSGKSVEAVYSELNSLYPDYFPGDITNEVDMLQEMAMVARVPTARAELLGDRGMQDITDYIYESGLEYLEAIKADEEQRLKNIAERETNESQLTEESSDGEAIQNYQRLHSDVRFKSKATQKVYESYFTPEVTEFLKKKYRISNNQEAIEAQYLARSLQNKAHGIERRLQLSDKQKALALDILCGEKHLSEVENTPIPDGMLEYIAVMGEVEIMGEAWANWRAEKRAEYQKQADEMYEIFNSSTKAGATNKAGFKYVRETQTRITYDIFSDDKFAEAKAFNNWLFTPERASEAQSNRYKNKMRDRVRELGLSRKVNKGDAHSEAAVVQMLGELRDVVRRTTRQANMGNADIYRVEGITYNEAISQITGLKNQNPSLDFSVDGKIQKAINEFDKIYDEILADMNDALVRNGYPPVPRRSGYFPHFKLEGDTTIRKIGRLLGIDTDVSVLPTGINGLTHTFKPGKTWFANALERKGKLTDYDAVLGFDKYIEGAANVIFHTDNIQRQRAFARTVRYNSSDKVIKDKIDQILDDISLTEEEKNERIQAVSGSRFEHSSYVVQLEDHTNSLAGKKTFSDRDMEKLLGRKAYTWMKNIEGRVAANMIAGNLSSALSNFIPLQYCKAEIGEWQTLRAMAETLRSFARDDGFVDRSDFLTNRYGSEFLVKSGIDKVSEKLSIPMEAIDHFTAQVLVRAAYNKYLKKGASPELAMERANSFAAGVMADRSRGALPEIFNNKNPLYKSFTMFQVEVNNNLSHIFKDIPRENRDKWWGAVLGILAKLFFGIWIFNETSEKLTGRRMAGTDVIDAANDVIGDLSGYQLPNTWDLIEAIIKGEDIGAMFETNKVSAGQAILNLGGTAAEDLPFVSSFLGGGDLPVGSAMPDLSKLLPLLDSDKDAENVKQTVYEELLKPVSYAVLPFGANQLSKIAKGHQALREGGSYKTNSKGEEILQYPIYAENKGEAIWNFIKATVFGKSSFPGAREWVENDFKSLSARGTAAYKGMIAAGVPEKDAYDLVIDIASVSPSDQEIMEQVISMGGVDRVFSETVSNGPTSAELKCEIIRNADISGEGKAILYFSMIANESECKFMSSLQEAGADMGAVVAELLDTSTKSSDRKYAAIMSSGLPEAEQLWQIYLLDTSAEKSTHKRYYVASDTFGISPNEYRVANDFLTNYLDGNSKTNERVTAAVREYAETVPLTKTEKAVLWQLLSKSTSAKNNPFDVRTGERVLTAINNYDREEEEFYAKYGPQPQ